MVLDGGQSQEVESSFKGSETGSSGKVGYLLKGIHLVLLTPAETGTREI